MAVPSRDLFPIVGLSRFWHNGTNFYPALPTPWVKMFDAIAPNFPSQADYENKTDVWGHFWASVGLGMGALVFVGLVANFGIIIKSCCCCCNRRRRRSRNPRPSSKLLLIVGFLTLLSTVVGIMVYSIVGRNGIHELLNEIARLYEDLSTAQQQGLTLSNVSTNVSATLDIIVKKCPFITPGAVSDVKADLRECGGMIDEFNQVMDGIPESIDRVHQGFAIGSSLSVITLALPIVLVLLCIAVIIFLTVATRSVRGRGSCTRCCIRFLGPVLFAPLVFIVMACTTTEFGVGMVTASFCKDPNNNSLELIEQFANGTVYSNVSRFYINDEGTNPLQDDLQVADGQLRKLQADLKRFEVVILFCPTIQKDVDWINTTIGTSREAIHKVLALIAQGNVDLYFDHAVQDGLCKKFISGIGWLVIVQLVAGLVCLPVLTCSSISFFDGWHRWYTAQAEPVPIMGVPMG
eukprot:TRINITY_DN50959_c0_g1_i1.p1 TRINITY_DN50959_c0_g1~~TRINITY_DN50959_c0_g1_i1.p1  ORF type:complete len:486 (-),score=62.69 TRINITY_DN50959_c0_g1_i1:102-1490(-)